MKDNCVVNWKEVLAVVAYFISVSSQLSRFIE